MRGEAHQHLGFGSLHSRPTQTTKSEAAQVAIFPCISLPQSSSLEATRGNLKSDLEHTVERGRCVYGIRSPGPGRPGSRIPLHIHYAPLQIWRPGLVCPAALAQPFECPSLLVVNHRVPRSRQNRLVVESPLIEDVFVCCTSFLRMYIHRVSSRHWPSPLTHQDATKMLRGSRKACC